MILGLSLQTFTLIHVLISLFGIASGLVVMYGFLNNKRFDRWTAVFFDDYSIGQRNRFLLPVYASDPRDQAGRHFTSGFVCYARDAVPTAPQMAKNVRGYSVHDFVF